MNKPSSSEHIGLAIIMILSFYIGWRLADIIKFHIVG